MKFNLRIRMKAIGVIKEGSAEETRVSLVPEVVASIVSKKAARVFLEDGAGERATFKNQDYIEAGASIISGRHQLVDQSDIIVAIDGNQLAVCNNLANKIIVGLFDPFFNKESLRSFFDLGATLISLELIPRISRAQSMDVLSSQASIAGYVSVLKSTEKLNKVMPLMMTAKSSTPRKVASRKNAIRPSSASGTPKMSPT